MTRADFDRQRSEGGDLFMLLFSINSQTSFDHISRFCQDVLKPDKSRRRGGISVIGVHSDPNHERQLVDEGERLAHDIGGRFLEINLNDLEAIDLAFEALIQSHWESSRSEVDMFEAEVKKAFALEKGLAEADDAKITREDNDNKTRVAGEIRHRHKDDFRDKQIGRSNEQNKLETDTPPRLEDPSRFRKLPKRRSLLPSSFSKTFSSTETSSPSTEAEALWPLQVPSTPTLGPNTPSLNKWDETWTGNPIPFASWQGHLETIPYTHAP